MSFFRNPDGKTHYDNGVYVGDVLQDVDGYYKWWPEPRGGYLDEGFLLDMLKFLRSLNAEWDAQVQKDLAP